MASRENTDAAEKALASVYLYLLEIAAKKRQRRGPGPADSSALREPGSAKLKMDANGDDGSFQHHQKQDFH